MKLTKEEFSELRPINEWVIIKPVFKDEIQCGGVMLKLDIGNTAELFKHTPRTGYVVKTNHDIPIGTYIWYDYLSSMNALGTASNSDRMYYEVDGEIFIPILYEEIYAYRDADGVFCAKDKLIIRQHKEVIETSIIIPETSSKNSRYATVVYTAKNSDYEIGDLLLMKNLWGVPIESEYYAELGEGLYIAREKSVKAKIKKEEIILV